MIILLNLLIFALYAILISSDLLSINCIFDSKLLTYVLLVIGSILSCKLTILDMLIIPSFNDFSSDFIIKSI